MIAEMRGVAFFHAWGSESPNIQQFLVERSYSRSEKDQTNRKNKENTKTSEKSAKKDSGFYLVKIT